MKFLGEKGHFSRELHSDTSPVSCSCVFCTRFYFELGFGVNIKVVDNCVSFLVALV